MYSPWGYTYISRQLGGGLYTRGGYTRGEAIHEASDHFNIDRKYSCPQGAVVVEIVRNAMLSSTRPQNMLLCEYFPKNDMKHFGQNFSKHENNAQFDRFLGLRLISATNNHLNIVICYIVCLF